MTDNELVVLARAGDEQAFAVLMNRYQVAVTFHARRMLRNAEDANDVWQDASFRVFRHLDTFDPSQAKFSTWLFTIATRLCYNNLRDGKRQRAEGMLPIDDFAGSLAGDRRMEPDQLASDREVVAKLEEALERLSPVGREIIELRFLRGLSYDEIATATNCNLGTVKSRMNRARVALAAHLTEVAA